MKAVAQVVFRGIGQASLPVWFAARQTAIFPFSIRHSGVIFAAMTRMLHIPTASTAPFGARLAVNLRGLLLLTLR